MPNEEVPLREYIEALLAERDRLYDERITAQKETLNKRASELETRLISLNELREGVLTRAEYEAKHETLAVELARIRDDLNAQGGAERARARVTATIIASFGAVSGFAFIVTALLTHGFK